MQNTKDVKLPRRLLALVCGDYGTGKSIFASSFPTPGLLFDFDDGAISYRGQDFDFETYNKEPRAWSAFEKTLLRVQKELEKTPDKWKTVVVDSLTGMTDAAMALALTRNPKRDDSGKGPVWNIHYEMVKNFCEDSIRLIIALPVQNIIFTAHNIVETDQRTGEVISVNPFLTGQLRVKVPGYFDEVYQAFTKGTGKNVKYLIRTIPLGHYKARSRLSGKARLLPDEFDNNYQALIEHYENALKDKTTEEKGEKK